MTDLPLSLIAGFIVAITAAPLGCLVVWRRMAYFGDATGHAGLMGVALGLALGLPMVVGAAVMAAAVALAVTYSTIRQNYAADTMLGVFAHSALAIGLVSASFLPNMGDEHLMEALLGDILSITSMDIIVILVGSVLILSVIAYRWRGLLNGTLNSELLVAEGGSLTADRLIFTLSLALFVALAMKLVGVLLITAMLILPAAAARPLARSPEGMVGIAAVIGLLSVLTGMWFSSLTGADAGPSIILFSSVGFVLTNLARMART